MFKINGIPRKQTKIEFNKTQISIKKHPNGKLVLPGISKKKAIELLTIKGYL